MALGAGQIARAMAAERREMNRFLRDRDARRAARLSRLRAIDGVEREMQRAEFPCQILCGECGYLTRAARGSCPACGGAAWMDLGDEALADTIRDDESAKRLRAPGWVKAVTAGIAATAFGVPIAVTAAAPAAIGAAVFGIPLAYVLGLRPASWLLLKLKKERPYRWHLPLPLPAGSARQVISGRVEPGERLLRAPFTGRECVAFRVNVLFDAPGDARPPEWVVQEVESVGFTVAGHQLDGDQVVVRSPLVPVASEVSERTLERYLRERGLFVTDGDFFVLEAIVAPGEEVEVELFDSAPSVVSTLSIAR